VYARVLRADRRRVRAPASARTGPVPLTGRSEKVTRAEVALRARLARRPLRTNRAPGAAVAGGLVSVATASPPTGRPPVTAAPADAGTTTRAVVTQAKARATEVRMSSF
jgi:hypothetical protein